jgi:general secretion pathway protein A
MHDDVTSDPKFYFRSASHASAFELVQFAVGRGEGFIAITGESGTGKTTLCRAILDDLDPTVLTALVPGPPASEEELLCVVLQEFGVISREMPLSHLGAVTPRALLDTLQAFLKSLHSLGVRALVVIDDAHRMPARLLERVRMLSDIESDAGKLLQVLLVGQNDLRQTLRAPIVRQLDRRMPWKGELKPMSRGETAAYVTHRLAVAGGIHVSFSAGALARVHGCARGVPRLVNLVCDRALLMAGEEQADRVLSGHVDRAAESLDLARPNRLLLAWAR